MSFSAGRPPVQRKVSRIPGSFDDMEPEDLDYPEETNTASRFDEGDSAGSDSLHPPQMDEPSSLRSDGSDENGHSRAGRAANNTVLEEWDMRNKLQDFESSFLPEVSHIASGSGSHAADDSLAFGVPNDNLAVRKRPPPLKQDNEFGFRDPQDDAKNQTFDSHSPRTPPAGYRTPAPEQEDAVEHQRSPAGANTSALERMSSSPTAAKTVSRVQSMTSIGGYETADEHEMASSPTKKPKQENTDDEPTPRKDDYISATLDGASQSNENVSRLGLRKRPSYLSKRSSQARMSYDSIASSNTEASDATLGADYALQSGGALPEPRLVRKGHLPLSRTASLGSMASGVSAGSDDDLRTKKAANQPELDTLKEESPRSIKTTDAAGRGPSTPRPSMSSLRMPTDTVIANNVRNIQVPDSVARQFRLERGPSPDKLAATTPGPKRGMTLKEQRNTVEKLVKENFDLKMKVHFLDEALQRRSEDGIQEMITENVHLKSSQMRLLKDNGDLRKQVRELKKKLDEHGARESPNADQGYATDEERSPTAEEELIYLRGRVETNEVEIERLRTESIAKETEKRRLAEMVRSLGDTRGGVSDVGSREERDMWKDMLEAETIAREQSEDEIRRLRDEMTKMRQESVGLGSKRRGPGSLLSRSSSVEGSQITRAGAAELERLKHEVSELQKMISAQASTLTSRNKEKERLYQEIEDLKLGRMGTGRSIAGDSILERSASRARAPSQVSNGTRASRRSDPERESLEARINELRDEVSQLKLNNQDLQAELDEAIAELDAVDTQAQADADQFNEELQLLVQERDNALRDAEEQDHAFQQLKTEAQEEIDGLGDELDAKHEECQRLDADLKSQSENVKALQAEMRSASEGLIRLEEDAQQNLTRYQSVKAELDEANREVENLEKNLNDAESKIQRFTVQQESSHNEIAFLREEQDADKIKMGELESLVQNTHLNLDTEREKARDYERRLNEERQQHEAVTNQEKQEVQKMLNDLNRDNSAAREELRRLRKALSSKEIESSTLKDRLTEFEENLRQIFGDPTATRSTLTSSVSKMHREFEQASADLDSLRRRLDERESILQNRDALLESSGLEYRKIADLLERERQARKQDKHSFEQALKSHQQSTRALNVNSSRIAELEQARQSDRKRNAQLEAQYKDQLSERNQVLLTVWKKLSSMCGPDWAHNNSLINGNLPSQEVIGNILFWPGFSRNLLLALKQIEGTLTTFKDKVKRVERELWKEYQTLEHTLDLRTKKLERMEESWENMRLKQADADHQGHFSSRSKTPEYSKLKNENRLLKAELQLLQQQSFPSRESHTRAESQLSQSTIPHHDSASAVGGGIPPRRSSKRGRVERQYSIGGGQDPAQDIRSLRSNSISSQNHAGSTLTVPAGPFNAPPNGNFSMPPHLPAPAPRDVSPTNELSVQLAQQQAQQGNEKWIHRLRELERRLKAEREARLLDRGGMRKRLEERDAVNEELRRELERERVRSTFRNLDVDTLKNPEWMMRAGRDASRDGGVGSGGGGGGHHVAVRRKSIHDLTTVAAMDAEGDGVGGDGDGGKRENMYSFPAGEASVVELDAEEPLRGKGRELAFKSSMG